MKREKIKKLTAVITLFLSAFFVLALTEGCNKSPEEVLFPVVTLVKGTVNGRPYEETEQRSLLPIDQILKTPLNVSPRLITFEVNLHPKDGQGENYNITFFLLPDERDKWETPVTYHLNFCDVIESDSLRQHLAATLSYEGQEQIVRSALLQHGVRDGVAVVTTSSDGKTFRSLEGDIEITRSTGNKNECVGSFLLKGRQVEGKPWCNIGCNFLVACHRY